MSNARFDVERLQRDEVVRGPQNSAVCGPTSLVELAKRSSLLPCHEILDMGPNAGWKRARPATEAFACEGSGEQMSCRMQCCTNFSAEGRRFSFQKLEKMTNNFAQANVLGVGGFGTVYKGKMDDGTIVAVKRARVYSSRSVAEFQAEIDLLTQVRHKHLVSLIGGCTEGGELILVYEYMAEGTLRSHLYGSMHAPLSWHSRLEVCIGAARGLHYLHTGTSVPIMHRDVKTSNILLDSNKQAKLSDFGLSKFAPAIDFTHVTTDVKGTPGFVDPEYYRRCQLTQKSDVYSFGVVLLEAISGRCVIDSRFPPEQVSLVDWAVSCARRRHPLAIVDPTMANQWREEAMLTVVEIALKCVAETGSERPDIGEVLWCLEAACFQQKSATSIRADGDSGQSLLHAGRRASSSDHSRVRASVLGKGTTPCNLPFSRNVQFKGRLKELQEIWDWLHALAPRVPRHGVRSVLVSGIGGLGKTQLALEYAYQHVEEYDGILWVDAGANLVENVSGLSSILGISNNEDKVEDKVARVRGHLESGNSYLLIFDNVENLESLEAVRPKIGQCHIIITSRLKLGAAHQIELSLPELKEAISILKPPSMQLTEESDTATLRELAEELGRLPVALSAASRLLASGYKTTKLLARIRKNALDLLERAPNDALSQKSPSLHSLFEASVMSLEEEAQRNGPRAGDYVLAISMLRVAAWFGSMPIPVPLLTVAAQKVRGSSMDEDEDGDMALAHLDRLSLVQRQVEGSHAVFHCLLQAYGRARGDSSVAQSAVTTLLAECRCVEDTLVHFMAVWERRDQLLNSGCNPDHVLAVALSMVEHYFFHYRSAMMGLSLCDQALAWAPPSSRLLWKLQEQKIRILSDMEQDDQEAPLLVKKCLEDMHPEDANGLPGLLMRCQMFCCMSYKVIDLELDHHDLEEAEVLAERFVPQVSKWVSEGPLGDYSATDETGKYLSRVFDCLSVVHRFMDPQKSHKLIKKALLIKQQTFPQDHPEIQESKTNMTMLTYDQAATPRYQKSLEKAIAVLEIEKMKEGVQESYLWPGAARVSARHCAGSHMRAEIGTVLEAYCEEKFRMEPEHALLDSKTRYLLCELGRLQRDTEKGAQILQDFLAFAEGLLPPLHEHGEGLCYEKIAPLRDVGVANHYLGDQRTAKSYLEAFLHFAEHRSNEYLQFTVLYQLAEVCLELKSWDEAMEVLLRAQELAERVCPDRCPGKLGVCCYMAVVSLHVGNREMALGLLSQLLAEAERLNGPVSSQVADFLSAIGCLHALQGLYSEALAYHTRALDIRRETLGSALVPISLVDVAANQRALGKISDAGKAAREALALLRNGCWQELRELTETLTSFLEHGNAW